MQHFVNVAFCQRGILPMRHFGNAAFCQLTKYIIGLRQGAKLLGILMTFTNTLAYYALALIIKVNRFYSPEAIFATLHFLRNLQMVQISFIVCP